MVAKSFQVDDLVWAKMKGYSPWPGKIMVPPPDAKSKPKKYHHYVFFFGSNNHAWIPDESIELHSEKMVEKYGNKKTGLYQTAVETIIERSKGISKYHRPNESSETLDNENASNAKEQESSFDKSHNDMKPKNKSFASDSSTPKKFKKKIPLKKLTSVKTVSLVKKTARKRTHSSDQSEPDDDYAASISIEDLCSRSTEPYFQKGFRFDDSYAQLMSNVPPNLSYNTDGVCSTLTPTVTAGVLQRKYFNRPDTPPIDLNYQSEVLKKRKIEPIKRKIGFLGLGKIGQGIVKNLFHSGHSIIIWNQTPNECQEFAQKFNIQIAETPADVIDGADITFSCVSDADTAKQVVYGNCGVLKQLEHHTGDRKGYVEMTSMDPKVSEAIGYEIKLRGARYLEAPLYGSRIEANEGTLLIVAAGEETLYEECKSCLDSISRRHKYLGHDVGTASKVCLVLNMFMGTVYATVAESLALISRMGLKPEEFLDTLKDDVITSDDIIEKGMAMVKNQYVSNISLKQMQQDLNLGLSLGDKIAQPTPIFAVANEVYKHCKLMRYGDHDVTAVFEGTKP